MFSLEEREKISHLLSIKILKWAIPIFCIIATVEALILFFKAPVISNANGMLFHLLYVVLLSPLIILPILIFVALISLIVDIVEVFITRK